MPSPREEPRRARRRVWPLVVVGSILVLAGVWFVGVPRVVEGIAVAKLRDAGFADTRIEGVSVGLGRIEARGVQLAGGDAGEVAIPVATAEFEFGDLFAGRIDSLTLHRAVWTLPAATPERASAPPPASDAGRRFQGLPSLPLRRFVLAGAEIRKGGDDAADRVSVDGVLEVAGSTWRIDTKAGFAENTIAVTGTADTDGSAIVGSVQLRGSGAGDVALDGAFRVDPADQRIELRFDDASFVASGAQMSGIAADLQLHGLPMPRSREPQTVRWQELRVGAIVAGSGYATFELLDGPEVRMRLVQRTADAEGSIAVRDLRWAPAEKSFPMSIDVHDVPLREWLELASNGRISGDGKLSGELAIVLNTAPRLSIELRGGRLAAAPGGTVRFLDDPDTDSLIRQHVEQIAASTQHDTLVQERLVAALKEFRYSALEFALDPVEPAAGAPDGVTLRVHLAGEGTKVPQQVNMDVNLHGFDTALDTALAIKLGLDRAKERLDRKIEAPSGGPPKEKRP